MENPVFLEFDHPKDGNEDGERKGKEAADISDGKKKRDDGAESKAAQNTHLKSRPVITRPPPPPSERKISTVSYALVMQRLTAFLPEIQKANRELQTKDPTTYNIEAEEDDDDDAEQYVEMNLGLGVYEGKRADDEEVEELTVLQLPGGSDDRKRRLVYSGSDSEESSTAERSSSEAIDMDESNK